MEHLGCRLLIDLSGTTELLHDPSLPGKVAHDPCFNGRKVRYDKSASLLCNKCSTDQFRQNFRCGIIEKFYQVKSSFLYNGTGKFKVIHVVLGKIMYLHQSAGPSSGPVCTIELQKSMHPSVRTYGAFHCLVFFYGRF